MKKEQDSDEQKNPALRVGAINGRHKWRIDDGCEKCGLKRRWRRRTPDGGKGMLFGRPAWEFYVDGEWKFAKIACH